MARKSKLSPEERRKKNWARILEGQRRPGSTERGSKESWQRVFRIRMLLAGEFVSVNDSFVIDYFKLKKGFTFAELKKAYKKKVFEVHPDRGGTHEEVVECNRLFNELSKQFT